MSDERALVVVHPQGEPETDETAVPQADVRLDTFGGKIHLKWVPEAEVSGLGQMPFFIEFLETAGLFEA